MQENLRCRFDADGMDDITSLQMIRFELMSKIWGLRLEYESNLYRNGEPHRSL